MHSPMSLPSLRSEMSDFASTSKQMLKSFWVGQSESFLFDGTALQSEAENREALASGDDLRKITTIKQLLAVRVQSNLKNDDDSLDCLVQCTYSFSDTS